MTKIAWMVLMAWMWGCGTTVPEPGERWELVDAPKPPDPSQFKPKDDQPLYFPPDSFPWQPKDTPILVHTGQGHDLDGYSGVSQPKSQYGLKVASFFHSTAHPILPPLSKERTWIALDLPEMRFRGALHFFELVAGQQDDLIAGQRGPFVWTPSTGVWFAAQTGNDFELYIDALPGRRARLGIDEGTTRYDPPQVPSPWVELATRCLKIRCPFDIFVWKPEADLFFTIHGYFIYHGTNPGTTLFPEAVIGDINLFK